MVRRILTTVAAAYVLLLPAVAKQAGQSAQAPASVTKDSGDDPVVVRVMGQDITEKQVLEAIDQIARAQQMTPQLQQQKDTALFKQAVDSLVGSALLKNEAREKNITIDKAKVDEAFQGIQKRFPSEEEFKKAVAAQGTSETEIRSSIEENLLYETVIDAALKDLPSPTDQDIQKFYSENPNYFQTPEQVHAAHILLKVSGDASPEKKAEIKQKLESIRAEIEGKKITFAEAATRNSEDKGSSEKGGDLGFFARGQTVKPFEDAAFAAEPGSITQVVESQFGYHLIQVLEKKPAGTIPLEESKNDIRNFLEGRSRQEAIREHVEGLKAKAQIEAVMSEEEWGKRHAAPRKNGDD